MIYFQRVGNVSDEEAYNTWHMGQRLVIVTPKPDKVMQIASEYRIDSQKIGEVTEKKGIRIKNKGAFSKGEFLDF